MNPYLDQNYVDRTDEVEALYEPTREDILRDPHFYTELVNDLLFHWVYGTRETKIMCIAKKSIMQIIESKKYSAMDKHGAFTRK